MEIVFSIDELESVVNQIVAYNPNKVILFHGEMGVGKTTLIKQLCKTLGVSEATSSPTFSLVNEYEIANNQLIYHFDFYRLKNETEALDMGADDYFYSGNWCFIEWAEKIPNLIPETHSVIHLEQLPDGKRSLKLQYKGIAMNSNVVIIPFSDTYSDSIKILNLEWLTKYFKVEPKDEKVLSNPKSEIIDKGGFIFYAQYQGSIVGTVSLLKIDETTFELSKMAVRSSVQGIGVGKQMLEYCFEFAKNNKINTLILYSNRSLESAIHLYTKYGFNEIPLEAGIYERADIKMEKSIL